MNLEWNLVYSLCFTRLTWAKCLFYKLWATQAYFFCPTSTLFCFLISLWRWMRGHFRTWCMFKPVHVNLSFLIRVLFKSSPYIFYINFMQILSKIYLNQILNLSRFYLNYLINNPRMSWQSHALNHDQTMHPTDSFISQI